MAVWDLSRLTLVTVEHGEIGGGLGRHRERRSSQEEQEGGVAMGVTSNDRNETDEFDDNDNNIRDE
jgi:hypothetical protein